VTPAQLDMQAAHAARTAYHRAAERHAERALQEQDHGHRDRARYLARLALLMQRASAPEYEGAKR
jgi:cob(I)alamin adenosyltransferase